MNAQASTTPPASPPKEKPDQWGCLLAFPLVPWIIVITFVKPLLPILFVLFAFPENGPAAFKLLAVTEIGRGFLLGVPLLPLALFWRGDRYQGMFRTWLLAVGFPLVLLPSHVFDPVESQWATLVQAALALAYAGFVYLIARRARPRRHTTTGAGLLPALGLAAPLAYPWLVWGVLGSPLDILLNLVAGLSFGLAASLIVSCFWLHPLRADSPGRGWDTSTGGFVIGIALLIMASGFGFHGANLLLMEALFLLGWLLMRVAYIGRGDQPPAANWPALALLIGLTTAMPLAFSDTDMLSPILLLLSPGETLSWSLLAAQVTALIALLLGVMVAVAQRASVRVSPGRLLVGGVATALWITGGLLYLIAGTPGLYGDRIFVILKDQADVSAATSISDYDARRQFVYDTLVDHANNTQADLRATLDMLGVRYTPYYLVNAIEVQGGLAHRYWLTSRPEVDRVLLSPRLRPLPEPLPTEKGHPNPPTEPPWNLTYIGAPKVWDELGVRGEGIVIGQSDSGVQGTHPELQASYRGAGGQHDYNWLDPWAFTTEPTDTTGHGTHTLGTIVGRTVGIAPEARWFACRNLDRNLGNPALYLDCMQFMFAPYPLGGDPFTDSDPTHSAHVLNNSWGCPAAIEGCDPNVLLPAVRALRAAGIFVVVSAGNEGPWCHSVQDPLALYDEVFAVGAIDRAGDLTLFSSTGPVTVDGSGRIKPDIVAPGMDILSSYTGNTYHRSDGTSMAGPHIAGVVALMWSANPVLIGDIDGTERILIESARAYDGTVDYTIFDALGAPLGLCTCSGAGETSKVPNNAVGYGVVDAYAAVKMALGQQ